MTTREFIEMLQKEDPSGEAHVRMEGGVPVFCEHKPGYYDGAYSYIDKDGNYVTTVKGSKVDIYCRSSSEYVWDNEMDWKENEDTELAWERLRKMFLFEGYENRKDRLESFFLQLRKDFDKYVEFRHQHP